MLTIVSAFSDPGEDVLDPVCGRGTTILAARLLERGGVGIELDRDWAREAHKRVRGTVLDTRDQERAERWVLKTAEEARGVPEPKCPKGTDVKTWERAQRRLADACTVAKAIGVTV
jgi:hypothetical protein